MEHARFLLPCGSSVDLYRSDCLAVLTDVLSPGSVDVLVTSPPYNLGTKYHFIDDRRPRDQYLEFMDYWARQAGRVLAPDGSLFLNMGSKPKDPWVADDVARVVRKHLVLQNRFIWVKSLSVKDAPMTGHYKPLPGRRFVNDCWEYVFHFTHRGDVTLDRNALGVPYADESNRRRWKQAAESEVHCRGNVWFLPYRTIRDRRLQRGTHPATFPVALPAACLKLHGLEKIRLACDPFLGIGSSAKAAAELGVPFVGIELDALYWGIAVQDLEARKGVTREHRGDLEPLPAG